MAADSDSETESTMVQQKFKIDIMESSTNDKHDDLADAAAFMKDSLAGVGAAVVGKRNRRAQQSGGQSVQSLSLSAPAIASVPVHQSAPFDPFGSVNDNSGTLTMQPMVATSVASSPTKVECKYTCLEVVNISVDATGAILSYVITGTLMFQLMRAVLTTTVLTLQCSLNDKVTLTSQHSSVKLKSDN